MKNYKAENVEEFITSMPEASHAHLRELQKIMRDTVSGTIEKISWGVPFYRYHGLLAGFAPATKHVTFGLVTQLPDELKKRFNDAGYKTGNKTIQLPYDKPIPRDLILDMIQMQADNNVAAEAQKQA